LFAFGEIYRSHSLHKNEFSFDKFSGGCYSSGVFLPSEKSLIAKNSRSHKKPATKEEGSRNYLLPTALSFKHVEFFN
jgi:hypothetical protein